MALVGSYAADRRCCVDRLAELAAGHDRLDRLPHLLKGQLPVGVGGLEQHLNRGGSSGTASHAKPAPDGSFP
jgi:hypothetical protein